MPSVLNKITNIFTIKDSKEPEGYDDLSRRGFMKVATAFTFLVPGYLSGISQAHAFDPDEFSPVRTLRKLKKSTFDNYINTSFWVSPEDFGLMDLKLVETSGNRLQFTVLFQSSYYDAFPQDTYRVEHSDLGEFDLFLVPYIQNDDGWNYVASFNRQRR